MVACSQVARQVFLPSFRLPIVLAYGSDGYTARFLSFDQWGVLRFAGVSKNTENVLPLEHVQTHCKRFSVGPSAGNSCNVVSILSCKRWDLRKLGVECPVYVSERERKNMLK